jgi:nonsense-mediated mRNA decay protein 3
MYPPNHSPKYLHLHTVRYHVPPTAWQACELESRELLSLLLKRIRGLNKVRMTDAQFIWTEPHSRRIKVQLTVQAEHNNVILQQSFVVEFVVFTNQCPDCAKAFAGDALGWTAVCQLRQKVPHKRTFFFLEQQILKHSAHAQALNIKEMPEGMDVYFSSKSHAMKFGSFVAQIAPTRTREAEKLVSHDEQSNVYNYKHTYAIDIVPICREDLVFLPKKIAHSMGGISRLAVVSRVHNMIHLIDPLTLQRADCTAAQYWRQPFTAFANRAHQAEFVVLDVDLLGPADKRASLADVTVAREADFGVNDQTFVARCALGHLLQAGDTCAGYDLTRLAINDTLLDGFDQRGMPDIVLVRKTYPKSVKRSARRKFRLKRLDMEAMADEALAGPGRSSKKAVAFAEDAEMQFEEFVQDVEEDPDLRAKVNLYRRNVAATTKAGAAGAGGAGDAAGAGGAGGDDDDDDDDGAEIPEVPLEDMLEDLDIGDEDQ